MDGPLGHLPSAGLWPSVALGLANGMVDNGGLRAIQMRYERSLDELSKYGGY